MTCEVRAPVPHRSLWQVNQGDGAAGRNGQRSTVRSLADLLVQPCQIGDVTRNLRDRDRDRVPGRMMGGEGDATSALDDGRAVRLEAEVRQLIG